MKYVIQDMETMTVHIVEKKDMRRFLNDQIPQGTQAVYNWIDIISDFCEGKNEYFFIIPELMTNLGFRISNADGTLTL